MTIVVTLSVEVSSVERPNKPEQIASAYGMTNSDNTRKTLRIKMNGRRRPNLLRHLSLARPITGTKKNPSAGPIPSIILMFCSLLSKNHQSWFYNQHRCITLKIHSSITEIGNSSQMLYICQFTIYHIKGVTFICLSVCLYAGDGRPNGWADQDQTWHGDSC